MSKIKDTIEEKDRVKNIELDARYQREIISNKNKQKCNLENMKKSIE